MACLGVIIAEFSAVFLREEFIPQFKGKELQQLVFPEPEACPLVFEAGVRVSVEKAFRAGKEIRLPGQAFFFIKHRNYQCSFGLSAFKNTVKALEIGLRF